MSGIQGQRFPEQPFSDSSSCQDSLDNQSLEDFWSEVKHIKESRGSEADESSDVKTPDDGDLEVDWLRDTGLSTLINDNSHDDASLVLLSTLTRTQSAAVQRRVDNYTLSLRVKNKQPVRDVRDIFAGPKFSSLDSEPDDKHGSIIDSLQQKQHLLPGEEKGEACSDEHEIPSPTQCNLSKEEIVLFHVSYSEQAQNFPRRSLAKENVTKEKQ